MWKVSTSEEREHIANIFSIFISKRQELEGSLRSVSKALLGKKTAGYRLSQGDTVNTGLSVSKAKSISGVCVCVPAHVILTASLEGIC